MTLALSDAPAATESHVPRIQPETVVPAALQAQMAMEVYVRSCGLERPLLELVKLRASLMNGCAFCVDMHTQDALRDCETPQRLFAVPVWRETPFFSPRERVALAWTEAVTALGHDGVPDALYDEARAEFGDAGLVNLTMAVIAINGWNRLAVAFLRPPGSYTPGPHPADPA